MVRPGKNCPATTCRLLSRGRVLSPQVELLSRFTAEQTFISGRGAGQRREYFDRRIQDAPGQFQKLPSRREMPRREFFQWCELGTRSSRSEGITVKLRNPPAWRHIPRIKARRGSWPRSFQADFDPP